MSKKDKIIAWYEYIKCTLLCNFLNLHTFATLDFSTQQQSVKETKKQTKSQI